MQNIDWQTIYSVGIYIIKTYPLLILWNVILGLFLSLIVSGVCIYLLRKFGVIKRENKWYSRSVKLYIPALIFLNLFFAAKIGLIRGIYKGLEKDSYSLSEQVYNAGTHQIFSNDEEKKRFITRIQEVVTELKTDNQNLKVSIVDVAKRYDTKYGVVDHPKNWIAAKFADKYGDKIHTLALYTMLNAVPHVNVSESMSYEDFDIMIQQLTKLDPKDIEKSVVTKIQDLFMSLVKSQ